MSKIDWSKTYTAEEIAVLFSQEWFSDALINGKIKNENDVCGFEKAARIWGNNTLRLWRNRGFLLFPVAFKKPGKSTRFSKIGVYEIAILYELTYAGFSLPEAAAIIRQRLTNQIWVSNTEREPVPTIEEINENPDKCAGSDFTERNIDDPWLWSISRLSFWKKIKSSDVRNEFYSDGLSYAPFLSFLNITRLLASVDANLNGTLDCGVARSPMKGF